MRTVMILNTYMSHTTLHNIFIYLRLRVDSTPNKRRRLLLFSFSTIPNRSSHISSSTSSRAVKSRQITNRHLHFITRLFPGFFLRSPRLYYLYSSQHCRTDLIHFLPCIFLACNTASTCVHQLIHV